MSDSLKKFVDQNREGFDFREPSEGLWEKIKSNLPKNRVVWFNNIRIWQAAAIIFFSLSSYLMITNNQSKSAITSNKLQVEFSDLENFYNAQIAEKFELINKIDGFHDEDSYTQDLEKLDAMYQVLREQMKTHPTEKVKDALILNMLVRIDLLNQQIAALEASKKKPSNVTI
jgi:hypothetical protein